MKLTEAWNLSRVSYREVAYRSLAQTRSGMWWGSFGRGGQEKALQSDAEFTLRALRIARFDKVIVAAVSVIASLIPFWSSLFGGAEPALAASVTLCLSASFAFVMLYSVQTLSSFLKAESWAFLSGLPLAKDELSVITLFSFVRTVDYMVVGAVVSQVAVVAFITRSLLSTLVMAFASTVNMALAVTLSLWFSKLFYGSLARGGRSRRGTLVRVVFLGLWGMLIVILGFMFSATSYLMPYLNAALLGGGRTLASVLAAAYPFSVSILVAVASGSTVGTLMEAVAGVASVFYAALALFLLRWSTMTIREMSLVSGSSQPAGTVKDLSLKVRSPLLGYVWKDLRASSRNPATAFFYVLPAFETVVVLISTMGLPFLRASIVMVAAAMGGAFTLFIPLGLLNAEGVGISYTKGLPVRLWNIVSAKGLIAALAFIPVPLAFMALALVKPVTSPFILLLPVELLGSAAAGSLVEAWLFLGVSSQTRTSAVLHDTIRLLAGVSLMITPELAYLGAYFLSHSHALSVLGGGATAVIELLVVVSLLRRP
jgi:predicted permease